MPHFDESRPLRFTGHAEGQGLQRGISRDDVLHVLRYPIKREPGYRACHQVWGYTPGGRRVRLTIDLRTNLVVTVSNADRRRR